MLNAVLALHQFSYLVISDLLVHTAQHEDDSPAFYMVLKEVTLLLADWKVKTDEII